MSTRPFMTTQNIMSTDRMVCFVALLLTLTQGVASGEDPSLEPPTVFQAAGVAPSFFTASDALLDVRGRALLERAHDSEEGLATLQAIVDLKRFTLVLADVAIQHHFSNDAVHGLGRAVRQRLGWYNHSPEVEMTSPPSAVNDGRWHRITVTVPNVADESVGLEILLDGEPICRQIDSTTHGNYTVSDSRRPGQMPGRPLVNGKVMQWGIGAHLDRVNGSSYSYISPQRLDTLRGRYRNLLVTEGVQLPATTKHQ